jgi:hypothetical protein
MMISRGGATYADAVGATRWRMTRRRRRRRLTPLRATGSPGQMGAR